MSGYKTSFRGNWYCCVCKSHLGCLQNPNSASSTTCEDRSCSHWRCGGCLSDGYMGGHGPSTTLPRQVEEVVSPSQPNILNRYGEGNRASSQSVFDNAYSGSPSRPSPMSTTSAPPPRQPDVPKKPNLSWLLNDDPAPALSAEEAAQGGNVSSSRPPQFFDKLPRPPSRRRETTISLPNSPTPSETAMLDTPSPQRHHTGNSRSATSSKSLSVTQHEAALSSSCNTGGETNIQTDDTTISNAAKVEDFRHLSTDDSDNWSVASSVDHFYPAFSTVLGNNLAQDLKDVDLAQSGNMLTAQLEDFAVRFGNENASENHLRMMSIVYRHSRYEYFHDPLLQLEGPFEPFFVMWPT